MPDSTRRFRMGATASAVTHAVILLLATTAALREVPAYGDRTEVFGVGVAMLELLMAVSVLSSAVVFGAKDRSQISAGLIVGWLVGGMVALVACSVILNSGLLGSF